MTPQQILESLNADGIELICEQNNLKVRATKSKLTDEQKALISNHKSALLTHLKTPQDERNCGSAEKNVVAGMLDPLPTSRKPSAYKEYQLADGKTLTLTKEDFDRVVDVFRLLHQQSQKIGQSNGVT